jgi:hypothetical protein
MRSWKIRNRNRRDLWNKALVGKPEGKRPLGRPRRRWVDNIKWISRRWVVGMWTGLG